MSDFTKLSGVTEYGRPLTSDLLDFSCYHFFNWGLLGIGAFTNVVRPTGTYPSGVASHAYDPSILRPSRDPRFQAGQIWEGFRSNWVYESGIEYSSQPILVSGIYVDGVYRPNTNVGVSGYKINYPEGRIILNTPVATGTKVQCSYSFKNIRLDMDDAQWFKSIQFDSMNAGDAQFQQPGGSGAWDVLSANRIQLPAIIIGSVPRVSMDGLQLGNLSRVHYQDVMFNIIGETRFDVKQLHDIVVNQWERRIHGVDKQKLSVDGRFPLNYDGTINPSGYNYPQMVDEPGPYRWRKMTFDEIRSNELASKPPLFRAAVKATIYVDLP